jgi:hypothetical protein
MAQINNWRRRFRAGITSANPFASMGLDWCPRCKTEVDTTTQSHHQGTTWAYKRTCDRCGKVIQHAVYHNVPILSDVPLPRGTMEWVTAPGQDRR